MSTKEGRMASGSDKLASAGTETRSETPIAPQYIDPDTQDRAYDGADERSLTNHENALNASQESSGRIGPANDYEAQKTLSVAEKQKRDASIRSVPDSDLLESEAQHDQTTRASESTDLPLLEKRSHEVRSPSSDPNYGAAGTVSPTENDQVANIAVPHAQVESSPSSKVSRRSSVDSLYQTPGRQSQMKLHQQEKSKSEADHNEELAKAKLESDQQIIEPLEADPPRDDQTTSDLTHYANPESKEQTSSLESKKVGVKRTVTMSSESEEDLLVNDARSDLSIESFTVKRGQSSAQPMKRKETLIPRHATMSTESEEESPIQPVPSNFSVESLIVEPTHSPEPSGNATERAIVRRGSGPLQGMAAGPFQQAAVNSFDSMNDPYKPFHQRNVRKKPLPRSRSPSPDSEYKFPQFDSRYIYRGLLIFPPEGVSIHTLKGPFDEGIQIRQMPLHSYDVYKEAKRRCRKRSVLQQYLALPSDFLRERVNFEILSFHNFSDDKETDPYISWSLFCVCIEENVMMLFLIGFPGASLWNTFRTYGPYDELDTQYSRQYRYGTRQSQRSNRPDSRRSNGFEPVLFQSSKPRTGTDDSAQWQSAQHSPVSLYHPSTSITSRYPVSKRHQDDEQNSRMKVTTRENTGRIGTAKDREDNEATNSRSLVRFRAPHALEPQGQSTDQKGWSIGHYSADQTLDVDRGVLNTVDKRQQRNQEETINFRDANGRISRFPWQQARTYEDMKSLIRNTASDDKSAVSNSPNGQYDLIGLEQQVLSPEDWERSVQPGHTITQRLRQSENTNDIMPTQSLKDQKLLEKLKIRRPNTARRPSKGKDLSRPMAQTPHAAEHIDTTPPRSSTEGSVDVLSAPPAPNLGRVSMGFKYVHPAAPASPAALAPPSTSYFEMIEILKGHMPHLTNMRSLDCRNPNGGKLSCWDMPRHGRRPVLVGEAGPQDWSAGGGIVMHDILQYPTDDVRIRTIIIEDLSRDLIECVGNALRLNPEFFEEHLSQSGYQGDECLGTSPKQWSTSTTAKDYVSLKWHRPVHRNAMKPLTSMDRKALLDLNNGIMEWTSNSIDMLGETIEEHIDTSEAIDHTLIAENNIIRECWPLITDPEKLLPTDGSPVASAWTERASMYRTHIGDCPLVVILLDPLPRVRHSLEERSALEPIVRSELLYKQAYNRNSVVPLSGPAGIFTSDRFTPEQLLKVQSHLGSTNSTADDLNKWLDEAALLAPDNPDLTILSALLWVIHRDTLGFLHMVTNVLEDIGLASTDDFLVQTRLTHWRSLIGRFQVELPDLRTKLDAFARLAQDTSPIEPSQSIVSEFVRDTLRQIDILIEGNEKSYAALRADMGVLESRKGIAEAESVGKLTELAFIFIPLTFITGVFSMQIEELQNPAPLYAFIIASIVTIVLAYAMRLAVRSDGAAKWSHAHSHRVRKRAHLPPGSQVPAHQFAAYALVYPLTKRTGKLIVRCGMLILLIAALMIPISMVWTKRSLDIGFKAAVTVVTFVIVTTVVWFAAGKQVFGGRHYPRVDRELSNQ